MTSAAPSDPNAPRSSEPADAGSERTRAGDTDAPHRGGRAHATIGEQADAGTPRGGEPLPQPAPPDSAIGLPAPPTHAGPGHAEPDRTIHPARGYALYLTAALLFGINGTVSKVLLQSVGDAARVSQLRVTAAFLILLVVVTATNRPALRLRRSEWGPICAYGILGVAMTQWLYFVAIERMPIGIALLIEFTAPIMVVLWVRFAWHRPVRNTIWIGLALALAGLAMVAEIGSGTTLSPVAVAAAFGAAASLAVYYLLGETAGRRRDPVSLTMWGFAFAALLWAVVLPWWSFPWAALRGTAQPFGPGSPPIPLWLLATSMVVTGTILSFALVLAAIRHIGAAGASIVGMTEPLIASLVAWIVLDEVLSPVQIVGGAVILGGVIVAERARSG